MTPFFQVEGLCKAYAGVPAVNDLSFALEEGAIVGLVGPNGSGKSTTIDCLTGFEKADSGSWFLSGHELTASRRHRIARAGVARTFQAIQAYGRLSVLENLCVACQEFDSVGWFGSLFQTPQLRAVEKATIDRAHGLLDTVGLAHLTDAPVDILSYGQRKLLAIAGAMINEPRLSFLDEPVAGVNPAMIIRIGKLLREFNARGVTQLVVDHNMDFIMGLCDRVIVLDLGNCIADGPPSLIRTNQRVLEAYIGSAQVDRRQ